MADADQKCRKACWAQPLKSSNLFSPAVHGLLKQARIAPAMSASGSSRTSALTSPRSARVTSSSCRSPGPTAPATTAAQACSPRADTADSGTRTASAAASRSGPGAARRRHPRHRPGRGRLDAHPLPAHAELAGTPRLYRPRSTDDLVAQFVTHPLRPAPFAGGHPDRVRRGHGRSRPVVNTGAVTPTWPHTDNRVVLMVER